ncbi:MAG: type II toxin-antitoxin system RatA family toxin [Alphaproteobacteria bacterium]|nr:type II toxin-antitoxin system RatA family toxin [Alphaproteobacteria bacterium]
MPRHHETRILTYTATQMYRLVADIERYPDFLPWCKEARILVRAKDKVVADLVVGTRLFRETFTSEVMLKPSRSITVTYRAGPLSRLSNAWAFKPKGKGCCEVSFDLDFDFRSPLLRTAMGVVFERALTKMVAAFERRAGELYG